MFSEFTKELLLKRPEDPIDYLIEYIGRRTRRQVVCLQSYDDETRVRFASNISNKLNFKLIELCTIFKGMDYHSLSNEEINKKVESELKSTESVYKGIIISGYPNNLVQLDFIQKCGILPDRYFILEGEGEVRIGERVQRVTPGTAVFIPGDAIHTIVNTGPSHLRLLFTFPTDSFDEVQYKYVT